MSYMNYQYMPSWLEPLHAPLHAQLLPHQPAHTPAPTPVQMPTPVPAPTHVQAPTMASPVPRPPLAEVNGSTHNNSNAKQPAPPASGTKRSFEDVADDSDEEFTLTETCDEVRAKLRRFIDTGEMKLGQLHATLGVSGRSFNNFMNQSGKYVGERAATYPAAARFFRKREARGIKTHTPGGGAKRVKKGEERVVDLDGVQLDGETTATVPIFDACDEVRRKINAHLKQPGVTKAAFMRDIVKTYPTERKIQSKQLHTFLGQHGALSGNSSAVYYASYVYFEKLRIKEGKPKSKHRLEMEKRRPQGADTALNSGHVFCRAGERPYYDEYGSLHIVAAGGKKSQVYH